MRYAIRHWPWLVVLLDDGRVEIDTNVVERAIRPSVLTRKDALFAGSDCGARHWALAMTLIETAKLNGIDPMTWLADVLERVLADRACVPSPTPNRDITRLRARRRPTPGGRYGDV